MPIKTEKIIQLLEKGNITEKVEAFKAIKEYVTKSLLDEQKKRQDEATELQSISERL